MLPFFVLCSLFLSLTQALYLPFFPLECKSIVIVSVRFFSHVRLFLFYESSQCLLCTRSDTKVALNHIYHIKVGQESHKHDAQRIANFFFLCLHLRYHSRILRLLPMDDGMFVCPFTRHVFKFPIKYFSANKK